MSRDDHHPTTEIDIAQAKEMLEQMIKTDIVPFLWGPPGIGKSTIVRNLAQEKKWNIIDLRLSLLSPVDLRGLPVVDKKKEVANWYKPAFLPDPLSKEKGILFLDEINLAPHAVQAAAYQLILDKKLGEYEFPKSWRIIAAGNREKLDKANVFKMSAPLANRFVHFTVRDDFNIWREWAKGAGIRTEVIDYIATNSENFLKMPENSEKAFPTPRSWEFISDILNAFGYQNGDVPTENLTGAIIGAVGEGVGREFSAYIKSWDLTATKELVEDYYKTKKIKMPSNQNKRFAIIRQVFLDYKNRDITKDDFSHFKQFLSPEEKVTVEARESEEIDKND